MLGGKVAAAAAAALVLAGCQSMEKVAFKPIAGQEVAVRDGRETITSRKLNSTIVLAPVRRVNAYLERPAYVAMIYNASKSPQTFRYSGISAEYASTGQPLKVWTIDQLQAEERQAAVVGMIATAAIAGAAGAVAANNAGTSYGSGTVYNRYGSTSYTWRTYNPAAAQAVAAGYGAAGAAGVATIAANSQRTIDQLEQNVLKDNTLQPDEWYGGQFVFSAPYSNNVMEDKSYIVRIEFAGDLHEFQVTNSRVKI